MLDLDTAIPHTEPDEMTTKSTTQPAIKTLSSLVYGQEYIAQQDFRTVYHAITGEAIYQVSSQGINTQAIVDYAKQKGCTCI
jgi:oxepin-CoA hydrolase/3-oxo-5,6-dehydrosuberyl-CoA semialdehyde dehydrogenase